MCRPKGKGFCALLVWKQVQTLPIWNRVRFSRKLVGRSVWTYLPVSIPNEVERKTITRIRNGFWEIFFVLSFSNLLHFQLKKRKSFLFYSLFNFLPKRFSTNSRLNACYTDYLFIYLFLTMLLFVVFAARPQTSTRTIVLTKTLLGMTEVRLTALKSYR